MKNKQVNKKSLSPFPHNMAELRRSGSRGYNTARLLVLVIYIRSRLFLESYTSTFNNKSHWLKLVKGKGGISFPQISVEIFIVSQLLEFNLEFKNLPFPYRLISFRDRISEDSHGYVHFSFVY